MIQKFTELQIERASELFSHGFNKSDVARMMNKSTRVIGRYARILRERYNDEV